MTPWSRCSPHVGTSTPVLHNGNADSASMPGFLRSPSRPEMGSGVSSRKCAAAATVGFKAVATAVTCDAATSHIAFFVSTTPQRLYRRRWPLPQQLAEATPERLQEQKNRSPDHRPANSCTVCTRHELLNPRLFVPRETPQRRSHTAAATAAMPTMLSRGLNDKVEVVTRTGCLIVDHMYRIVEDPTAKFPIMSKSEPLVKAAV